MWQGLSGSRRSLEVPIVINSYRHVLITIVNVGALTSTELTARPILAFRRDGRVLAIRLGHGHEIGQAFFTMIKYRLVTPRILFFCMADTTCAWKRSEDRGICMIWVRCHPDSFSIFR